MESLDYTIQKQFKKKLEQRLDHPKVNASQLFGSQHRYKIKLRQSGFRPVYEVIDKEVLVLVVAVGKRELNARGTSSWNYIMYRHCLYNLKELP